MTVVSATTVTASWAAAIFIVNSSDSRLSEQQHDPFPCLGREGESIDRHAVGARRQAERMELAPPIGRERADDVCLRY